jgi:hypothetical protein
MPERKRIQKPTSSDINETLQIFEDFFIKGNVPAFNTRFELFQWRKEQIINSFA